MQTIGLLLMAYGSPDRLEDMRAYLLDIRGGRETPDSVVEEITHRYAAIGGRSPLLDISRRQGEALAEELNRRFAGRVEFKAYAGMRHWDPRIRQAVEEMAADGIRQAVGLVLAPHSSSMSTGAYFAKVDEAFQETGAELEIHRVESWYNHPGLIAAIAEKAVAARAELGGEEPYTLFTAHSLPSRILKYGDQYEVQLKETARLLAERLNLTPGRWNFSFQSAGQSAEPWLGPQIEQEIERLASAGEKNILVVPIGFVSDHVEVLYDIDIAGKDLAQKFGAQLVRSASLNDSPAFIQALADIVQDALPINVARD